MALHRPWYEFTFGGVLGIENQIPGVHTTRRRGVQGALRRRPHSDDYRFHTIHIYVDEEHGGHVGEFAEQYLDTDEKRRSACASTSPAPKSSRGADRRRNLVTDPGRAGYSTVRKAMAVISAFSYSEPVLGVSELAPPGHRQEHGAPHPGDLVADGFAERTADERYRLSLKLYEIGQEVAASSELRERAHPSLERLRNESGETAHLAVLAGTDVVYVDRLESPQMLHMLTRVGRRRAAHATSSGKCLLALGPPAATSGSWSAACRASPRARSRRPSCSSGRSTKSAPAATRPASRSRRPAWSPRRRCSAATVSGGDVGSRADHPPAR